MGRGGGWWRGEWEDGCRGVKDGRWEVGMLWRLATVHGGSASYRQDETTYALSLFFLDKLNERKCQRIYREFLT